MPRDYVVGMARAAMVFFAAVIAIHALRYYGTLGNVWFHIDPRLRAVIQQAPVQALTHMLIAPIALFVGPFQFYPRLRARAPRIHRWLGRIYVAACLIAGMGALATTPYASGGPTAGLGFGILAVCWIITTSAAWQAAVRRDFNRHRLFMRYSYAMTFAAVTLRLQIPIGFALGGVSYSAMSRYLSYTSWLPNVILVALYSAFEQRRRPRSAPVE